MQRVLLTGAAGSIGTFLRRELAGVYAELVLADIRPIADLAAGEAFQQLDITDLAACEAACEGVDGILHFAGQAGESDWEDIRAKNIDGAYNIFEAARRQRVKRLCFATSNHAVGFYPREQRIGIDHKVLPELVLRRLKGVRRGTGRHVCHEIRPGRVHDAHRQRGGKAHR